MDGRQLRALGLGAAAALLVGAASLAYLHVQIPPPRLPQPSPPPPPQLSATDFDTLMYDFVTPSLGWATDTRSSQSLASDDLWIFHTSDGPGHWVKQLHSPWQGGPGARVVFFDQQHGFVYPTGPGLVDLYRTVDGGAHWAHPTVPSGFAGEVTFADATHGWVLGDAAGAAPEVPEQLYATTNGGDSWFQVASSAELVFGLAMRGPDEGWDGTTADGPEVLLSQDGGRSWEPRHPPGGGSPPSICSSSVTLLPGDGLVARFSCKDGSNEQLSTFDEGQTWMPVDNPPPDESSWDRTTFIDRLHWWTMTGGDLWKTADGGQTWKDYGLQINDWEYIPHALDSSHGWAQLLHTGPNESRQSGLVMTADGGIHWTQVNAPRP
jgi:photosystem II stability/assembly factor-like uncharacterized protein